MWVALFFLLLPATPLQAELQQSFDPSFEEDFQQSFSIGSPKYKCHRSNSSSKPESDQLCHYCYTTWREDVPGHEETQVSLNNSKKIVIEEQGCFNYDGSADDAEECNQSHCTNLVTDGQSFQEGHRFCCCIGHYCNHNFTSTAADLVEDLDAILEEASQEADYSWLLVAFGALGLVIYALVLSKVLSAFRLIRIGPFKFASRPDTKGSSADLEIGPLNVDVNSSSRQVATDKTTSPPSLIELGRELDFSDFVLSERVTLGNGQFGSALHRAHSPSTNCRSTTSLSVKVFNQSQKQAFYNERDVYELVARSPDENIKSAFLQYFGTRSNVRLHDGSCHEFMIGLEHNSRGFLSDYLAKSTVTWPELCRVLTSISSGLAFLHSGLGVKSKTSSLCHRDLNSGNVLVRSDLSCCICNFERSVCTSNTPGVSAEGSLAPVGTPRYLAPELLEVFSDQPSQGCSLKQADVYALGLLFWEISRRCHDLYQGVPVPEFQLAYGAELNGCVDPSLDQMRVLVSKRKARPLFPQVWKNSNPAVQRLREIMEDAWDTDGEARTTATCVQERSRELAPLWDHYHHKQATVRYVQSNNNFPASRLPNDALHLLAPTFHSNQLGLKNHHTNTTSLSTNDGRVVPLKNDNINSQQQPLVQLQPHQGRNPCLERNNRVSEEDEETSLVQGSFKDHQHSRNNGPAPSHPVSSGGSLPTGTSVEETPLGDLLIRSIAQPITYLKNDFSQTEEGSSSASVKKGSKRVPKFFRVTSDSPQPVPVFKQPKSKNVNQEVEEQQQRLLQQQACSQNVSQGDTSQ